MGKRTDQKQQRIEEARYRLKKAIAVFFCIALMAFFINTADMATRRMMMLNDDKYAMAVSIQEESMLRLDFAGEKLMVNLEPAIKTVEYIASNSKKYFEIVKKAIADKFGS